jgi:hypothetical protein
MTSRWTPARRVWHLTVTYRATTSATSRGESCSPSLANDPPSLASDPPSFEAAPASLAAEPASFANDSPSFEADPPSFRKRNAVVRSRPAAVRKQAAAVSQRPGPVSGTAWRCFANDRLSFASGAASFVRDTAVIFLWSEKKFVQMSTSALAPGAAVPGIYQPLARRVAVRYKSLRAERKGVTP